MSGAALQLRVSVPQWQVLLNVRLSVPVVPPYSLQVRVSMDGDAEKDGLTRKSSLIQ